VLSYCGYSSDFSYSSSGSGIFADRHYGHTEKELACNAVEWCFNLDLELFANSSDNVNIFILASAVKNINFLTST
jgi:hypothetical protein